MNPITGALSCVGVDPGINADEWTFSDSRRYRVRGLLRKGLRDAQIECPAARAAAGGDAAVVSYNARGFEGTGRGRRLQTRCRNVLGRCKELSLLPTLSVSRRNKLRRLSANARPIIFFASFAALSRLCRAQDTLCYARRDIIPG